MIINIQGVPKNVLIEQNHNQNLVLWVIVIREAYQDLLETTQEHHEALAFRSVDVLDYLARDITLAKERS